MSAMAPAPVRRAPASGPLLPRVPARLVAFTLLALVGAIGWGGMVIPAGGWALVLFALFAAAAGVAVTLLGRLPRAGRLAAAAGLLVVFAASALLASGVPLRFLVPGGWDHLASGLAQGAETSPGVTVPYSGEDEWVRAVLMLGAPILLALAAMLAFWPRSRGRLGFPVAAAVALAAVSAVPAVQVPGDAPLVSGAVLAVLLVAFLGLERVPRRAAPVAAGLVAVATVAAIVVAPAFDAEEPFIDYEEIAQSLTPEDGSRFAWDHEYGPIDWPRDGSEVLRVRAPRGTYWKATALTVFNGLRWERDSDADRPGLQTEINRDRPDWISRLRFTVRAMSTEEFLGAGTVLSISKSPRQPVVSGPGEFRVEDRPLRSGHTYEAQVYVPRPSTRALAASGTFYPAFVADELAVELPPEERGRQRPEIRFSPFGSDQPTLATVDGRVVAAQDAEAAIDRSAYGRTFALAQRLRAGADTPYEYIRAVERHLDSGFTYSEIPPERQVPLDAFLFVDRAGYCQQFSGAMALLLRMGGVPARVATGFSPGALDRERQEYVVRDTDAHSWVEVYIPGSGWVAFDPTPSEAPARSRDLAAPPALPRDTPADPGPSQQRDLEPEPVGPTPAEDPGTDGATVPRWVFVLGGLGLLGGAVAALLVGRRRRARQRAPVEMALGDLDRAMRRVGHPLPADTTLGALGRRFAGSAAEPYIRALERARYGDGTGAPGPRERAGLRRVLGARGGPFGRLKAWWALPPG